MNNGSQAIPLHSIPLCTLFHSGIMSRTSRRLPSFCGKGVATRVRVRTPPIAKPIASDIGKKGAQRGAAIGRRIMIMVDSSPEAKGALKWALSHAVQSLDTLVLLQVLKPSKQVDESPRDPRSTYALLYDMRTICHERRPEVEVELSLIEGKERGPVIVAEAKQQGISLLVIGQKKRSIAWRLLMMRVCDRIRGGGGGLVDYCVQNAICMTLAVRRKGRRAGGYLITTRHHKDFWLLA